MTLNPSDSLDPPVPGPPLRPVEPVEDLERVSGTGGAAAPLPRALAEAQERVELCATVAQLLQLGGRIHISVREVPVAAFAESELIKNVRVLQNDDVGVWIVAEYSPAAKPASVSVSLSSVTLPDPPADTV